MRSTFTVLFLLTMSIFMPIFVTASSFAPDTMKVSSKAPIWGNPDAKVEIVIYSDFQCPSCGIAKNVLRKVLKPYKEKVKLRYAHYPLDSNYNPRMGRQLHPEAGIAAVASFCAQEQGAFWEYHDKIFDNQRTLSATNLLKWAGELNLDMNQFSTCFSSEEAQTRIKEDLQLGHESGVNSTPSIFLNGKRFALWQNEQVFDMFIQQSLRESYIGETEKNLEKRN